VVIVVNARASAGDQAGAGHAGCCRWQV